MDDAKIGFVSGTVVIVSLIFIVVLYFMLRSKKTPKRSRDAKPHTNPFKGDFFYIHNHTQKEISVVNQKPGSSFGINIASIPPSTSFGINEHTAMDLFGGTSRTSAENYNKLVIDGDNTGYVIFGNIKIKSPPDTLIKALHIGMVSSKTVGSHVSEDVTPGANAVQGRSRVYIHNLTPNTLRLNDNIVIPPNNTLIYFGKHLLGVALGTVFKDQNGIFNDFIYTIPATDIIYGINSDVEFPSYSGFCLDEKGLTDIPHEPNYLLEEGFMGGPVFSHIDPLFIPTEGPMLEKMVDRWGRVLPEKDLKKSNFLDNRKPFTEEGKLHIV
jgi:hypothetical protein